VGRTDELKAGVGRQMRRVVLLYKYFLLGKTLSRVSHHLMR